MNLMRRLLLVLLVAGLAMGAAGPAAATAGPGTWEQVSDRATWDGATTELTVNVRGHRQLLQLDGISVTVQLPPEWANRYCAFVQVGVNGVTKAQSYRDCDTNGDARLWFLLPDLYARPGDVVELWASDPVSRFDQEHAAILLSRL